MPEYLSPGVYVEEVPSRFKAIEGVSTSTTAFVGPTQRGPVPGFPMPFVPPAGFSLVPDPAPVLVTSFGDFVREFGPPLPLPDPTDTTDNGYLGHAAKAYFDNGGRRLWVCRIVGQNATRSEGTAALGMVLKLARSAREGDQELTFESLRGMAANQAITFQRRADASPALMTPGTPSEVVGGAEPFAMAQGQSFSVEIAGLPTTELPPVAAAPRTVTTVAAAPFNLPAIGTFDIRIGAPAAPVITVTFDSGADGYTPGNVSAAELTALLMAKIGGSGVSITDDGSRVTIATDVEGSDAYVEVIPGGVLAFTIDPPAVSNVADVSAVTIAEIAALLGPVGFTVTSAAGNIRLATAKTGATANLALVDGAVPALAALGLAAGAAPAGQDGVAAPPLDVVSYDTGSGRVTLLAPLPGDLDRNEVYAVSALTSPLGGGGPTFYARSPGPWSADVRIAISPFDRPPVPITAPAAAGTTLVQVRSTGSFYVGAIVEIDSTTQLDAHEITAITGQTLEIAPPLANAVDGTNSVRALELNIVIEDESGAAPTEVYRGLSWNRSPTADTRRHYASAVNARSRLVYVDPGPGSPTLAEQPSTPNGFPMAFTQIGVDDLPDVGAAGDTVFLGADNGPGLRTGLEALTDLDGVSIIAIPGRTTPGVQLGLIAHCELMRYRVAVLDGELDPAAGSVSSIIAHRNAYDSSYANYYAPWIGVTIDGESRFLPPSGYLTGVYARTDNERGVWKAPANESVFNALSLRTEFTTGEQDVLNPIGINLIRRFDQRGIVVWGGRTLSSDPEFRYVSVRRTLIAIEESIEKGTQWVVFEPNSPETWLRVRDSVSAFLQTWWRDGALFGRSEDDAFFVRCDETTMSADDIQNGRLICRIGVAIVRPAEFVIFRIEQTTGLAQE